MSTVTLLVLAVTLLVAVLLSGIAERSILSIAVLFLAAGFISANVFGIMHVQPQNAFVAKLIELAIFSVLFTDGMRFDLHQVEEAWRLPGRALILGMPLTFAGIALLAHFLTHLSWKEALLVGAVLSPTDPVFATAIVQRKSMPTRLRELLNTESGLNDGLALPAVVLMLSALGSAERTVGVTLFELALGVVVGALVPYLTTRLAQGWLLPPSKTYKPLNAFAIGLLVLALSYLTHANIFLAAFTAGITIKTFCAPVSDAFQQFGEAIGQLLKLTTLLFFGALISTTELLLLPAGAYLFAALTLIAVRPIVIELALIRSSLSWQERAIAAWFGPRGFSSIFYAMLVLRQGIPGGTHIFHIIAIVIVLSIIAHSSTDVALAQWFQRSTSATSTSGLATE